MFCKMGKLENYINELLSEFQCHIKEVRKHGDEESIHALRLSLKRIFTLIKFIDFIEIHFSSEPSGVRKTLKQLFKQLGEIRDLQLALKTQKLILGGKSLKKIGRIIKPIQKFYKAQLLHILNNFNDQEVSDRLGELLRILTCFKKKYLIDQVRLKLEEDIQNVGFCLAQNKVDYHLIRKKVKQQYYLLLWIKTISKEKVKQSAFKLRRQLAELLGMWNDVEMMQLVCRQVDYSFSDKEKLKLKLYQSSIEKQLSHAEINQAIRI